MKITNIKQGQVSVDFDVWELPMLATIGRLAESQAFGSDAPQHECTDTVGMYASLFSSFCEVAGFAAKMMVDPDAPLTLEGYRANDLYYNGRSLVQQGQQAIDAAREQYPAFVEGEEGGTA